MKYAGKTCSICAKEFSSSISLNYHTNQVHNKSQVKIKCDICGQLYEFSYINKHIEAVHNKIKSFQCDICEEMFHRSKDMKWHISKVHNAKENKENQLVQGHFQRKYT